VSVVVVCFPFSGGGVEVLLACFGVYYGSLFGGGVFFFLLCCLLLFVGIVFCYVICDFVCCVVWFDFEM